MSAHEALYGLLYRKEWSRLLDALHTHREAIARDALMQRAAETFVRTFFAHLAEQGAAGLANELDRLFLLHNGGFYRLEDADFDHLVETLVRLHGERPEKAAAFARFRPDNPHCAEVLRQHGPADAVDHSQRGSIYVAVAEPLERESAAASLFKSRQEVEFFMAVREVYPTFLVYPNAPLSVLVEFDRVRDRLTADEREYFFRGRVDCVVFDQHELYRPLAFFELDSPHHDAADRRRNDRRKERILALAGLRLWRIRKQGRRAGRREFVRLLKEVIL